MGGDRHVREFIVLVTLHRRRRDPGALQHKVDQVVRAGAGLAVDEAHVRARQVRHPAYALGIARHHEQPGIAHGQVDQQVFVGVQPLGIQAQDGRLELALGHLEAGQVAIVAAQQASASAAVR